MSNEFFDVIIIGAGLSGIGAGCHFKKMCPGKTFAILEGRSVSGGTWDLFRYPGIRSDSDMFTLGYNFKPWTARKGIAEGGDILNYIREAATENDVDSHIRYNHMVSNVDWDSKSSNWTVTVQLANGGGEKKYTSQFIMGCTGYYNYKEGYTPEFEGVEDFQGQIVHPQKWPEDIDYNGKKIVVIGSGATAVTLAPSLSKQAEKVTMLQRSPTYVMPVPSEDALAIKLREYLPEPVVYKVTRGQHILLAMGMYNYCKYFPDHARKTIFSINKRMLPKDYDMRHFTPKYNPWDERLCAVPGGDMFRAIRKGKMDVETDHIERFTKNGILLKSGKTLEADIIVTATGLKFLLCGGIDITLDGKPYDATDKMSYRGVLFEGLPNAAVTFGYTNSSWTLKADLIADWFCRLINHMDNIKKTQVVATNFDDAMSTISFVDLSSGYVARAKAQLPLQGTKRPWKLYQNFFQDFASMKLSRLSAKELQYTNSKKS